MIIKPVIMAARSVMITDIAFSPNNSFNSSIFSFNFLNIFFSLQILFIVINKMLYRCTQSSLLKRFFSESGMNNHENQLAFFGKHL